MEIDQIVRAFQWAYRRWSENHRGCEDGKQEPKHLKNLEQFVRRGEYKKHLDGAEIRFTTEISDDLIDIAIHYDSSKELYYGDFRSHSARGETLKPGSNKNNH